VAERTGNGRIVVVIVKGPIARLLIQEIDALGGLIISNAVFLTVVRERAGTDIRGWNVSGDRSEFTVSGWDFATK